VQAGRLTTIEEALAGLGSEAAPGPRANPGPARPAPAPQPRRKAEPPAAAAPPASQAAVPDSPAPSPSGWRHALHAALLELGLTYTADAVEHSEVAESGDTLNFVTPREYSLAMQTEDLNKAVRRVAGRPMKINVRMGEVSQPSAAAAGGEAEDELARRVLSNPEVQRFREVLGGQVRQIRNLKE
jgi:hypothetical protein